MTTMMQLSFYLFLNKHSAKTVSDSAVGSDVFYFFLNKHSAKTESNNANKGNGFTSF